MLGNSIFKAEIKNDLWEQAKRDSGTTKPNFIKWSADQWRALTLEEKQVIDLKTINAIVS